VTIGRDGGQATVELALVLPLVAVVALLLVQVGLVVRAQVLVTHASREGARAAAVVEPPRAAAARAAALASLPFPAERIEVALAGSDAAGDVVTVEVRLQVPTDVPLVGLLVGEVGLTGSTTMRVEQPRRRRPGTVSRTPSAPPGPCATFPRHSTSARPRPHHGALPCPASPNSSATTSSPVRR
jgi:Flp pilus assembly protein TadG